jgi:hypothetical protein
MIMKTKFLLSALCMVGLVAGGSSNETRTTNGTIVAAAENNINVLCLYYYANCVKNCKTDEDCRSACHEAYLRCQGQ